MNMKRRDALCISAGFLGFAGLGGRSMANGSEMVEVFKSPSCGCCMDWIRHLEEDGFIVSYRNVSLESLDAIRRRAGVPDALQGCHTALIAGYVVEGHVPSRDIRRLLEGMPEARGLSVPGMPIGSPGMGPEDQREAYDVILIAKDGTGSIFASYPAA